jgi:hypothetical protein
MCLELSAALQFEDHVKQFKGEVGGGTALLDWAPLSFRSNMGMSGFGACNVLLA